MTGNDHTGSGERSHGDDVTNTGNVSQDDTCPNCEHLRLRADHLQGDNE